MPKLDDEWKVMAHEPLLKLAENLLWARGSIPRHVTETHHARGAPERRPALDSQRHRAGRRADGDPLGPLFTTLFGSAPGPRVSRLAKLGFIKDKQALRADFERYAALPNLTRSIVAHEKVASGPDARAALLQAAHVFVTGCSPCGRSA